MNSEQYRKRRVLVTGAAGFVGRQIVNHLISRGIWVRAVIRKGQEKVFSGKSIQSVISSSDLFSEDSKWWLNALDGIDTVIHTAWYTEPDKYLQSINNLDCLIATINIAKWSVKSGVKKFVGIGTCFEYDLSYNPLTVESPLRPQSLYAVSKVATFMTLSQLFNAERVQFSWCRLFYLYGEGEHDKRLIPYIHKKLANSEPVLLTKGDQIRDFINVNDAGRLIAETSLNSSVGPVNICSGIPITVREIAEKIADGYGRRDLLKFGARPENYTDPPCVVGLAKSFD